ncbi:MAG: YdeI/OmpD-associated family protein [Sphingobacteriales bacterium]
MYLNTHIRNAAGKDVGDSVIIQIEFDPVDRTVPMHPKLKTALKKNKKANMVFQELSPSLQKEIMRYIHHLKSEASVEKNVTKAILFLTGKGNFAGREKP